MKSKYINILSCLAILLSACQIASYDAESQETEELEEVVSNSPITFKVATTTRAAVSFTEDDKIGIYMVKTGNALSSSSVIDDSYNRKYIYSDDLFQPATSNDALYYPTSENVDFIAYYPYCSVSNLAIDVDVSNQSNQSNLDLRYSNNLVNVSKDSTTPSLNFTHQLTSVVFYIKAGEGVEASELTGLTLYIEDLVTKATFNLSTGTLTTDEDSATSNVYANISDDGSIAEMILIPQTISQKSVRVTLASHRSYEFILKDQQMVAGNIYSYSMTIKKDYKSVEGLTATITPWVGHDTIELEQKGGSTLDSSTWDGDATDVSWYDSSVTSYQLTKASQLAGLSSLVNNGTTFDGCTITLMNDILLENHAWTPIGNSEEHPFKGTFIGGGNTIRNISLKVDDSSSYFALFGNNQGIIKDLVVSGDETVKDNIRRDMSLVSMLVALNGGTVSNCRNYSALNYTSNTSATSENQKFYIGGLVARNLGTIENSQNNGALEVSVTSSATLSNTSLLIYNYTGGIAGGNSGTISYCDNNQSIHATGGRVDLGGVVGLAQSSDSSTSSIEHCENYGLVKSETSDVSISIGGVLGLQDEGNSISYCSNEGTVKATSTGESACPVSGGIVGTNKASVAHCSNKAYVYSYNNAKAALSYAGGIAGVNPGEIHTSENALGAIVESSYHSGGISCYNTGKVYDCCSNNGSPIRWTNTGSDSNPKKGVTTDSHVDK